MDTGNTAVLGRKWLRLSLQAPGPLVEAVSDLMGVLSGSGVELSSQTETGTHISGFFPVEEGEMAGERTVIDMVQKELEQLFRLYEIALPKIEVQTIDDQDWATSWKQFFTPVEIVPGLVIKPSWETYQAVGNVKVIEMDPGQAFGTGQHESTRMALALLASCFGEGPVEKVLDVGTGTGILAMAAVLFGAQSAVAIDNDPEAVRVAKENVVTNDLGEKIAVSTMDLTAVQGPVPLILANIVHDVLVDMAPLFREICAPGGRVILAGILSGEQEENIIRVYGELGFFLQKSLHEGEWAALLLR